MKRIIDTDNPIARKIDPPEWKMHTDDPWWRKSRLVIKEKMIMRFYTDDPDI